MNKVSFNAKRLLTTPEKIVECDTSFNPYGGVFLLFNGEKVGVCYNGNIRPGTKVFCDFKKNELTFENKIINICDYF